jgi:hypothetical protein
MTIQERKEKLLKCDKNYGGIMIPSFELWLTIHQRLKLRIWVGIDKAPVDGGQPNTVYMRLDESSQYSAPLNEDTIKYVTEGKHIETVKKLLKFGFNSSVSNLDEILNITKDMNEGTKNIW